MTAKQRKAIERTIRVTHQIHGRGSVVAVVWGVPWDGFVHDRQGMVVYQMQYGMGATHFTVADDYKTVRYLHRDRLVLSK